MLNRIRSFSFSPSKEFAAARGDTVGDAFKYFVPLMAFFALILAIVAAGGMQMLGIPAISRFAPLLGVGAFVGILIIGIFAAMYISVWLHIWTYLLGGREGFKQTVKAVTYGSTPCLVLCWVPGANILIAPIWSLLLVINGLIELHEMSAGMAILSVVFAILVPPLIVGLVAAAIVPMVL
ncbi:MAG: YIP1 family protein [Halobacteriota archaeon]